MLPIVFAQVGLGSVIEGIVALAMVFGLAGVACVMGSLGLVVMFAKPSRAVQGVVAGAIGLVMWCGMFAVAYATGLTLWSSLTGLIVMTCGAVSIIPVLVGTKRLRQRGG